MYNELRQLGTIDYENPVGRMRPLKLQEKPLSYLTKHQVSELLTARDARTTSPHPKMVARICLATGARWGEAQALTLDRLKGTTVVFGSVGQGNSFALADPWTVHQLPWRVPYRLAVHLDQAAERPGKPCTTPHICQSFHHEWRAYRDVAAHLRARLAIDDNAIRSSISGSSLRGCQA